MKFENPGLGPATQIVLDTVFATKTQLQIICDAGHQ